MPGTKTLYLPNSAQPGLPRTALPKQVESEVMRENAQMVQEFYDVSGKLEHYEREMKNIYGEHMRVVLAKPNTTVEGLKPNYYHVIRLHPGHPAAVLPVENDDGTWRDLDSRVFEQVARADMWNDRTQRELQRQRKESEEARLRQLQREGQARAAEFDDRLYHAQNVHISVPRGI